MLDREGIARTGRGVKRRVPPDVAERIMRARVPEYTSVQMRVLAGLSVSPLGLSSVRRVAAVAGISPTSASAALAHLVERGLVQRRQRRGIRAGRTLTEVVFVINLRSKRYAEVQSAVRAVRPPARASSSPVGVPRAFWHLFWNAQPAKLRLASDGVYIARRMLGSDSMSAAQWALQHVAAADLRVAVAARGLDGATRAMVRHWLCEPGAAAS